MGTRKRKGVSRRVIHEWERAALLRRILSRDRITPGERAPFVAALLEWVNVERGAHGNAEQV